MRVSYRDYSLIQSPLSLCVRVRIHAYIRLRLTINSYGLFYFYGYTGALYVCTMQKLKAFVTRTLGVRNYKTW